MWKTIWRALTSPIVAVLTGRYEGHIVTRNPFRWLGMFAYGLFLIPFTLFVYPVAILLTYVGLLSISRTGNDVRFSDDGLEVVSKKSGHVAKYRWEEIEIVQRRFHPPFFYPALKLVCGDQIDLHLADFREVADRCRENGIAVNETTQF